MADPAARKILVSRIFRQSHDSTHQEQHLHRIVHKCAKADHCGQHWLVRMDQCTDWKIREQDTRCIHLRTVKI